VVKVLDEIVIPFLTLNQYLYKPFILILNYGTSVDNRPNNYWELSIVLVILWPKEISA